MVSGEAVSDTAFGGEAVSDEPVSGADYPDALA
jgi:hypothetical protein